jgi:hypothetical protein
MYWKMDMQHIATWNILQQSYAVVLVVILIVVLNETIEGRGNPAPTGLINLME